MMNWLISLPPYQNVLMSLAIAFAGLVVIVWACAWLWRERR